MRPKLKASFKHLKQLRVYPVGSVIKIITFNDYKRIGGGYQTSENSDRVYTAAVSRRGAHISGTASSFVADKSPITEFWESVICDRHF